MLRTNIIIIMVSTVPDPQSVIITGSSDNIVVCGSTVIMNCTIELDSIISVEDLPLLNVSAQIFRNGTLLKQTSQSMDDTTYNYGATVNSFCQSDNGKYIHVHSYSYTISRSTFLHLPHWDGSARI